jgi:UDP-galactopyranose mutase
MPADGGGRSPLPFISEQELARKYYELMPEHVYSTGRAGSYRYGLDIDDCIEQAMLMAQQIKEGGRDYPVPVKQWR